MSVGKKDEKSPPGLCLTKRRAETLLAWVLRAWESIVRRILPFAASLSPPNRYASLTSRDRISPRADSHVVGGELLPIRRPRPQGRPPGHPLRILRRNAVAREAEAGRKRIDDEHQGPVEGGYKPRRRCRFQRRLFSYRTGRLHADGSLRWRARARQSVQCQGAGAWLKLLSFRFLLL